MTGMSNKRKKPTNKLPSDDGLSLFRDLTSKIDSSADENGNHGRVIIQSSNPKEETRGHISSRIRIRRDIRGTLKGFCDKEHFYF